MSVTMRHFARTRQFPVAFIQVVPEEGSFVQLTPSEIEGLGMTRALADYRICVHCEV